MSDPPNREARQQGRTRAFNEWIEGANESMGLHTGTDSFRCECGDGGCGHPIDLTRVEYESVRSHPTRFIVAHNHENPESDRVVAEHERYTVVEKIVGLSAQQAQRSDPRNLS
jgi:hypothetical protein